MSEYLLFYYTEKKSFYNTFLTKDTEGGELNHYLSVLLSVSNTSIFSILFK